MAWLRRLAIGVPIALVVAVYVLRLDRVVGLIVDDAWYALLGRAIARGDGYRLVNAPVPGVLPPNPPGFALLLSLVFRIAPIFPSNILWLKTLSIAAMFVTGAETYVYLRRRTAWPSELAGAAAAAVVLVPSFVFLATSTLMSECVFTAVQLGTILVIDRARTWRGHVAGAIGAAIVMLIRTAGAALPVGVVIYFALTRQWRRAVGFAGVVLVGLAPWLVYSRLHTPTMAQRLAHGGAHAFSYGQEFWMRWAGDEESGVAGVRDLPARVWANAVEIGARDVGGIIAPALYRGASESGQEVISIGGGSFPGSMGNTVPTMILSLTLSTISLIGLAGLVRRQLTVAECVVPASVGMILLWPQWTFRFVLPLAPFLLLYLVEGVIRLAGLTIARVVVLLMVGLSLVDHGQYIAIKLFREPDWLVDARDTDAVIDWLSAHPTDGIIGTTNPALVYLRTGATTIAITGARSRQAALAARGVDYLVNLRPGNVQPPPDGTTVRFRSPQRGFWVAALTE
jgi:hypothetical protein